MTYHTEKFQISFVCQCENGISFSESFGRVKSKSTVEWMMGRGGRIAQRFFFCTVRVPSEKVRKNRWRAGVGQRGPGRTTTAVHARAATPGTAVMSLILDDRADKKPKSMFCRVARAAGARRNRAVHGKRGGRARNL